MKPSDIVAARAITSACLASFTDYAPSANCMLVRPPKVETPIELAPLARQLSEHHGFAHISIAAHTLTHRIMQIVEPPKGRTTKLSPAQQKEVWEAAEVRRQARYQRNLLRAGMSGEDLL